VVPFLGKSWIDLLTMPHRHRPEGDHHPSHSNTSRDNLTWCGHGIFAHNLIKISGLIG
jgi:hypothetical protein